MENIGAKIHLLFQSIQGQQREIDLVEKELEDHISKFRRERLTLEEAKKYNRHVEEEHHILMKVYSLIEFLVEIINLGCKGSPKTKGVPRQPQSRTTERNVQI